MPELSGMLLLVVVLALLFDFSNGWHDSVNAIATVVSREMPNGPRNLAPRTDEGPEKPPILHRGLACLTTHWPIITLLRDEKGCLCQSVEINEERFMPYRRFIRTSSFLPKFIPFIREKRRPIMVRVPCRQPARYRNGHLDMSPGAGAPPELLAECTHNDRAVGFVRELVVGVAEGTGATR